MKMDIEKNNNTKENNKYDQHISNLPNSKEQQIYRKNYQVRLSANYQYLNCKMTKSMLRNRFYQSKFDF